LHFGNAGSLAGGGTRRLWLRPEIALPPSKPTPRLEDYPIRVGDIVRLGDIDHQGHVNNAVFATYFESGRVGLIYDQDNGLQVPGATSVVARLEIDFLGEVNWPGTVEIGTAVDEIGRSSYRFTHALFHKGACAATGRTTMVLIDRESRRSRPLPPELIERLRGLMLST
jgi:acyl-CoA thioester hydrolase